MPSNTEYETAFEAGANQELKTVEVYGIKHALIPAGRDIKSFERLMLAPSRIVASPCFSDQHGFVEYFKEFKEDGTRIFVNDNSLIFTTVFDCHHKDQPAWGDHSASYELNHSSEWKRFNSFNNKKMDQRDFAEFLEDNMEHINGPIKGLELLQLAQNININFKGTLAIEETVSKGLKSLIIKDESRAFGIDTAGKEIEFPDHLVLSLRVFKNGPLYDFTVKLRQRTNKEQNCLIFWISITDSDAIEEKVFDKVIESIKEETGITPLKGAYKGRSHK